MSSLFDTQQHLDRGEKPDTELTLSTASLLGIFFALVLVCAVFFGFGYSMGRRSANTTAENKATATNATNTVANTDVPALRPKPAMTQDVPVNNATGASPTARAEVPAVEAPSKRSAGQPAAVTLPMRPPMQPAKTSSAASSVSTATGHTVPPAKTPPASRTVFDPAPPAAIIGRPMTSTTTPPSTATVPAAQPAAPQPTVVQIAAVSHQEDAEVLIAALKKRGYNVGIRHEPQDQLMHVQVGPFSTRAEAVSMRQKLLADGYNAIVKP